MASPVDPEMEFLDVKPKERNLDGALHEDLFFFVTMARVYLLVIAQILRKTGRKAQVSTLPPAKKPLSVTLQAIYTNN